MQAAQRAPTWCEVSASSPSIQRKKWQSDDVTMFVDLGVPEADFQGLDQIRGDQWAVEPEIGRGFTEILFERSQRGRLILAL